MEIRIVNENESVDSSLIIEELNNMIEAQYDDKELIINTKKENIPNTKGIITTSTLIYIASAIGLGVITNGVYDLLKLVLKKLFSRDEVYAIDLSREEKEIKVSKSGVYVITIHFDPDSTPDK